ncbi:MAG: type II toxin-antitoxin system RelE/ParE family toxin [bacterium]
MPIRSWADEETKNIYHGADNKKTRKKLPKSLHEKAQERLEVLDNIHNLYTLSKIRGYWLEKLKGDRKGQFSIRINDQFRICFYFKDHDAYFVEISDYH